MPHSHPDCNDLADLFRGLDQVGVEKMGVARRGPVPPLLEQLSDQGGC